MCVYGKLSSDCMAYVIIRFVPECIDQYTSFYIHVGDY